MRPGILRNPLFAARPRAFRPDKSEPQLLPLQGVQAIGPAPAANAAASIASADEERIALPLRPTSAPDRIPAAAAGPPLGTFLYLALVGLIAAAISASFGAGFFLLAAPSRESIAASGPNPAHSPQTARAMGPVSLEAGLPAPNETAASPDLYPPRDAAPTTAGIVEGELRPAASGDPLSAPALPGATQAANVPIDPPGAAPSRSPPTDDPVLGSGSESPGSERAAHPRRGARRTHYGSAGDGRSSAPPQSRSPRSLTPSQAERAASFGQLLTQLTGKSKASGNTLTPPPAAMTSPIYQPASAK